MKTEAEIHAEIQILAQSHKGGISNAVFDGVALGREIEQDQVRELVEASKDIILLAQRSGMLNEPGNMCAHLRRLDKSLTAYQAARGHE